MEETYILSTKVPLNEELDNKTSDVFKALMEKELGDSIDRIILEINQSLKGYTITSYFVNNDKHVSPKYLKMEIEFRLNGENKDLILNLASKIFEEINNPIRITILNAMGNDLRLDYKIIDEIICHKISPF
jgi:hypothetical protein